MYGRYNFIRQYFGANEKEDISKTIGTIFTAGAAIVTVFSQAISMILDIIYHSKNSELFKFKMIKIHKEKLTMLVRLGSPLSLQEVLLWASFLVVAAIANNMGVAESAAVGIVVKFEVFLMLVPMAIYYALAALTAQNIGANQPERARTA